MHSMNLDHASDSSHILKLKDVASKGEQRACSSDSLPL